MPNVTFSLSRRQTGVLLVLVLNSFVAGTTAAQELRQSAACDVLNGSTETASHTADSTWSPPALSEMSAEMEKPHPIRPFGGGVGWKDRPTIVMGAEPYSGALPKNWVGTRVPEWRAVAPWFVVYPSEEEFSAPNSAVQIGKMQLWVLERSSGAWKRIAAGDQPSWQGNYDQKGNWVRAMNVPVQLRQCAGVFAPARGEHAHGGLGKVDTPWNTAAGKADIDALLVIVQHRLVRIDNDKPDDRSAAKFLVMAGADYYPTKETKLADLNAAYVPGAGLGQFKLAKREWQYASMLVWSRRANAAKIAAGTPPTTFSAPEASQPSGRPGQ